MYKMKKKYANWFFCIINMYTKYTLAVCVFMFYWFFLLSLKNECFWKVTTSTGLSILGSLIKTTMFTLLDVCAGEWLQYTFNFLEWVLKKKNICLMFWTICLVSVFKPVTVSKPVPPDKFFFHKKTFLEGFLLFPLLFKFKFFHP